jgi:hypothetical protein
MTTFILSELGCKGNCQQGKLPCDCKNTITVDAAGVQFSYTAPSEPPCVIVNSGASVKVELDATNDEQKVMITKKWEF